MPPRAAAAPRPSRPGNSGSVQASRAGGSVGVAAQPAASRCPAASSGSSRADRLGHALHEPALAQPAGAEHHAAHAGGAQHAPQHHRGVRQVVDAAARQPRQTLQRAAPGAGDHARPGRAPPRGRSCSDAPSAADSRSAPCGCAPAPATRRPPDTGRAPAPSASHGTAGEIGLGDRAGPHRIPAGPLRQPYRAEAQRMRNARACHDRAAPVPASRRRCRPGSRRRSECRTARPSPSIRPPAVPTERGSARPACARCRPATKSGAVPGVAHRGGGQHLERLGAHRARHRVIAVHHGQRLRHAVFVQPPGRLQAAAEPQHRLLVEDRHRVAAAALVDHEAHRVRTEIDHRAARRIGWRREGHAVSPG